MRFTVPAAVAVILGSGLPASAETAVDRPGYVGRWAKDPAACRNHRGTSDVLPLLFSAQGYEGLDEVCRFERIGGGAGRWTMVEVCSGEGESRRDRLDLTVEGNRLTMRYPNGQRFRLSRCPS